MTHSIKFMLFSSVYLLFVSFVYFCTKSLNFTVKFTLPYRPMIEFFIEYINDEMFLVK